MITLYQPPRPGWPGIPNMSPFCIKLEMYLRMTNTPYTIKPWNPQRAPKGKMPYIKYNERLVGDSGLIVDLLKNENGDNLDGHLSNEEKAIALSVRRMIEEHTYFCVAWQRWSNETSFAYVRKFLLSILPPLLGPIILRSARKDFLKTIYGQGVARHTPEEIETLARQDFKAVSDFLGTKPFLMGDKPTSVDATAYAFLLSASWNPWESPLKEYVRSLKNLEDYCLRLNEMYWKDLPLR